MENNVKNELNDGISFVDILMMIKKEILFLIVITLVIGIAGAVYGYKYTKPVYRAQSDALVVVGINSSSNTDFDYSYSLNLVQTFKEFMTTDRVMILASQKLSEKYEMQVSPATIKSSVTVVNEQYSLLIRISAVSTISKEFAIDMANILIYSTIEIADEELVTSDGVKPLANKLIVNSLATTASMSSKAFSTTVIAFLIGIVLGVVIIIIKYTINDTYTSKEEFENQVDNNVLVMIPNYKDEGDNDNVQEKK